MDDIQALRAQHESDLLRLEGVVGVSTGEDEDGKPVLVVYTSRTETESIEQLPEALSQLPVKFVYTGEIEAQDC